MVVEEPGGLLRRSTNSKVASTSKPSRPSQNRRKRGSGGVQPVRDGVWRVDVEVGRDPVTGQRRRVARVVHGAREDAEIALARLKVADHEKRLPIGGTNARSVRAAFQLYLQAVDSGLIELAPATVVTSRSAAKRMCSTELADGRTFGDIRLSRLTWSDIESLYAAMRAGGNGPAWVRRCATVLTRALELARKRGLIDANPVRCTHRIWCLERRLRRVGPRWSTRPGCQRSHRSGEIVDPSCV